MSMYNLLEYSKNYRKTTGSFYNYYRDELRDDPDNANHDNIEELIRMLASIKTK